MVVSGEGRALGLAASLALARAWGKVGGEHWATAAGDSGFDSPTTTTDCPRHSESSRSPSKRQVGPSIEPSKPPQFDRQMPAAARSSGRRATSLQSNRIIL